MHGITQLCCSVVWEIQLSHWIFHHDKQRKTQSKANLTCRQGVVELSVLVGTPDKELMIPE